MQYKNPEFFGKLIDVITDEIYVCYPEKNILFEARKNLWAIAATQDEVQNLSLDDFLIFLEEIKANRKEQTRSLGYSHDIVFYCWFDEQACHLCFSMISGEARELPFKRALNHVTSPNPIIESFLSSQWHDRIPWSELELVGYGPDAAKGIVDDFIPGPLDVYVVKL